MLTILILVVGSVTLLVALLLVIVVIGIRQEPPTEELREQAPSLTTVFVRRLLGVYVRKPPLAPTAPEPTCWGEVKKLLQAYTVEQVAEMLHVGRDKVYYLLRTGQLRSIKIGKLRRITEQHLAAFIASREDVAERVLTRGTSRDVLN
jgi:excisionase family DNA binding protein